MAGMEDLYTLELEMEATRKNATTLENLAEKERRKAQTLEQAFNAAVALRKLRRQEESDAEKRRKLEVDFSSRAERGSPKLNRKTKPSEAAQG